MGFRPLIEEKYKTGSEEINYVVYQSRSGLGKDEVLQHKFHGTETAHITIHPDGTINFREKRSRTYLHAAVKSMMAEFTPRISPEVRSFIERVEGRI
jgi:hypothetical protein